MQGARNSSAQLARVLSHILSPLTANLRLITYCDDALLVGQDFESHVKEIDMLLSTLYVNNLRISPKKAVFAAPELDFLGAHLSKEGMRPTDQYIKVIKALKPPRNKRDLQRVLGAINFVHSYMKGCAIRMSNMRQLLQKNTPFIWSTGCQREFEDRK